MIQNGTKPTRIDHRDYSHKSFGSIQVPFPSEYNTDCGVTMPNQNIENDQFTPPIPPLPFGCTDYCSADVSTDFNATLFNPEQLDTITHANADGGIDIRTALKAAISIKWFTGFFNIEALDGQDIFDAIRDAMISGGTEKRSVSVGSKWFPEFETVDSTGILPIPNFNGNNFTWHNWKICGWKTINDQVYLVGKSWQGFTYGNKGFCYFSRPLFNQLMSISGSVAFTATKGVMPPISTISLSWLQWLISHARNLLPYS